jgi:hypothetical protein
VNHPEVAWVLIGRGVRVRFPDGRPTERGEFGGSVEFHGAGAERNHGLGGSKVFGCETANVAEEIVFVCVRGEDRMAESGGPSGEGSRENRKIGGGRGKFS